MSDYLTTRELALLLRLGERKVYDLASSGEIPCVRATGKLLFPRAEIMAWLAASRSGPQVVEPPLPSIVAGSHDPLLDWAIRESGSGLATYYDGSFDGLSRLADRSAQAAALHIHEEDGFNAGSLHDRLGEAPIVLIEVARRQRGLLLAPDVTGIDGFADLAERNIILRQPTAASQHLFLSELTKHNLTPDDLQTDGPCARTEEDMAIALKGGKGEAGFGLGAMAKLYGLGFIPTHSERVDLAIWRRAAFDPPMQALLSFLRSDRFASRADEMGGYDLTCAGQIHRNGANG